MPALTLGQPITKCTYQQCWLGRHNASKLLPPPLPAANLPLLQLLVELCWEAVRDLGPVQVVGAVAGRQSLVRIVVRVVAVAVPILLLGKQAHQSVVKSTQLPTFFLPECDGNKKKSNCLGFS